MKRLNQVVSAWMLGITARALRDLPDVPRNRDGSYNARELVKWARSKAVLDVAGSTNLPGSEIASIIDHAGRQGEVGP
ncbi:MAG TPA: hypothetical protein VJL29_00635 [Thermoguttaceae bacterium]|nr:hypothetical protein [Thermoguttaceae bacterium]